MSSLSQVLFLGRKMGVKSQVMKKPSRVTKSITKTSQASGSQSSKARQEAGSTVVSINRAPVLTLWITVCMRQLGHKEELALTAAKAVTALCARAKGRSLGIIPSSPKRTKGSTPKKENDTVRIAGMNIPVAKASHGGLRATNRGEPMDPQQVQKYLTSSFKENLQATRSAMEVAARRRSSQVLRSDCLSIYEKFRPEWRGWGVKGELSLKAVKAA
mmetsp:Transcript_85345/g.135264  ORF Transcript_85345/g.135264 Transcript_85345/m.135264 type:complete len:216 (-) Transcript_85345:18-665(-)